MASEFFAPGGVQLGEHEERGHGGDEGEVEHAEVSFGRPGSVDGASLADGVAAR